MVQPETPLSHVPEHGLCVRCGVHLADGRETLPCRADTPTIPAPPSTDDLTDDADFDP